MMRHVRPPTKDGVRRTALLLNATLDPPRRRSAEEPPDGAEELLTTINDVLDEATKDAASLRGDDDEESPRGQLEEVRPPLVPRRDEEGRPPRGQPADPPLLSSDPVRRRRELLNLVVDAVV